MRPMKAYFDHVVAHTQHARRLRCIQLFDVAQEHHQPIGFGKAVDAGPNNISGLTQLDQVEGGGRPVARFNSRKSLASEARQEAVDGFFGSSLSGPQTHKRSVHCDAMQPSADLARALERMDRPKGGYERLLNSILRLLVVPQDPPTNRKHAAGVNPDQRLERFCLTRLEGRHELFFLHRCAGHASNIARAPLGRPGRKSASQKLRCSGEQSGFRTVCTRRPTPNGLLADSAFDPQHSAETAAQPRPLLLRPGNGGESPHDSFPR